MYTRAIAPGASRARPASWDRATIRSTWSAERPASGRTTWCCTASRSNGLQDREQLAQGPRPIPPRGRRLGEAWRHRRLHAAGPRHSDRLQAGRRARPVEGRPADRRALRQKRRAIPARRLAPRMVETFCIARRLVEAGARYVSLNFSRWDWHGPDGMNYVQSRDRFSAAGQGLSALVTDLHERGLDKHVSVVVWGEFGRTPQAQQQQQPRSLAEGQRLPCWPAAACGPAR